MSLTCPLDGHRLQPKQRHGWLLACPHCGLEASTLEPAIASRARSDVIVEDVRQSGLDAVRRENAQRLLKAISQAGGAGRLLDVGSGPGFFLDEARRCGFDVTGVEPDSVMAEKSRKSGMHVEHGFFPQALPAESQFDVIVLNDVLEHIPQLEGAFEGFHQHLAEGGLLVLNSPDRNGVLYRLARNLDRMGLTSFLARMWQVGLPSPHVWYFTRQQLRELCEARGFSFIANVALLTLSRTGLYDRVSYVRTQGRFLNMVVFALLWAWVPLMRYLPSDIAAVIVRKGATPH